MKQETKEELVRHWQEYRNYLKTVIIILIVVFFAIVLVKICKGVF